MQEINFEEIIKKTIKEIKKNKKELDIPPELLEDDVDYLKILDFICKKNQENQEEYYKNFDISSFKLGENEGKNNIINTNISKVRKGGRKTTEPSMNILQEKLFKLMKKWERIDGFEKDSFDKNELLKGISSSNPNSNNFDILVSVLHSENQLIKDLSKIEFGIENMIYLPDGFAKNNNQLKDFVGFHTTKTGLSYFGIYAGNDYETPIAFILYYDGKKIRGYIPYYGNSYNPLNKAAFGNDEELDEKFIEAIGCKIEDKYDFEPNLEMILYDIENRIEIIS